MFALLRCFFKPDGAFRLKWDLLQVLLILWSAITLPFTLAFVEEPPGPRETSFWFTALIDLFFIVDITLNFRTAIFVAEDGEMITDLKTIAREYGCSWFIVDLLSCLPFGYINLLSGAESDGGDTLKLAKTLRLFRVAKMLRLLRLRRLIEKYQRYMYAYGAGLRF